MRCRTFLPAVLLLALPAAQATAADFLVNSAADLPDVNPGDGVCATVSGSCTFRAAIQEANARPGLDYIDFAIGVAVLTPATVYPTITDDLVIDGRTSPGYSDTSPLPLWKRPAVFLDGNNLSTSTFDGLRVRGTAANPVRVEIYGLGITRFPQDGINLHNGKNVILDANWIGINRNGNASSFGNGRTGMALTSCTDCIVGALAFNFLGTPVKLGLGNAISGNGSHGILMALGTGNTIGGNEIGPVPGSSEGIYSSGGGNAGDGIQLLENDARIGMHQNLTVHAGNIVLFNSGHGMLIGGSDHLMERNRIGHNGGDGIRVIADDTTIAQQHNITNNGGAGVRMGSGGVAADRVVLEGAYVYMHSHGVVMEKGSGLQAIGNAIDGATNVAIQAIADGSIVADNRIGGQLSGNPAMIDGIVASGNNVDVVRNSIVSVDVVAIGIGGSDARVEENLVGMDRSGTINGNGIGIYVEGDGANVRSNLVVASIANGIEILGDDALVCGNRIGSVDDATPAGNGLSGIYTGGNDGFIGDYPPAPHFCLGNHVTNNTVFGIDVAGQRNRVGNNLFADNALQGIQLTGAHKTQVLDNHLLDNVLGGIRVGDTSMENRLQGNLFSGTALDIDLGYDGPTANDPGDADTGANRLMNYPDLVAVFPAGAGALDLTYRMDVATGNATRPFAVDIYLQAAGSDTRQRIHSDTYDLPRNTQRTIFVTLPPGVGEGLLLAMATDGDGNSSELGSPIPFSVTPTGVLLFADGFED